MAAAAAVASTSNYWEDLRKQAREIENELDMKLVSFSKMGTGSKPKDIYRNESGPDSVPLLQSTSGDHMFETKSLEIEQLLQKLTSVNAKMTEYVQNQNSATASASMLHTLQRHGDILKDYSQDFTRTSSNIQARKDREDLLGSVRRDIDAYKNATGLNRRTDLFLKESEHLRSSERLVDDQISIAVETKDYLLNQRAAFKAIQMKVNNLANQFPLVNSLVHRINLKKRRDSVVLGLVIAACTILLIMYAFN